MMGPAAKVRCLERLATRGQWELIRKARVIPLKIISSPMRRNEPTRARYSGLVSSQLSIIQSVVIFMHEEDRRLTDIISQSRVPWASR